jgi:predicted NAD-dependent protein-ADP-ribosyltransferase YbiA (DUF1768 family)
MELRIEDDGITHVNIYSKGRTELGRMLSNFYKFPVDTRDGKFNSVEGYWHWLGVDEDAPNRKVLTIAHGIYAKTYGAGLKKTFGLREDPDFEKKILEAIWRKFRRNKELLTPQFAALPFEHYYEFGGKIVNVKDKYKWMIEGIEKMRGVLLSKSA